MNKKIITLQSCPKHYTYDQDKACSPEETVARFRERLQATRLDILEDIRRIDNGRLDIPVYFSVCGADARRIIGNKKQMGKGSTPEQSRASACMELGERFTRAIDQDWPPVLSAGFGTFLGMLIVGGIGIIPCLGGLVQLLVALVGIGAVALTVFGSRPYPLTAGAPTPAGASTVTPPEEPLPPAS